jgi:hypothetical protein
MRHDGRMAAGSASGSSHCRGNASAIVAIGISGKDDHSRMVVRSPAHDRVLDAAAAPLLLPARRHRPSGRSAGDEPDGHAHRPRRPSLITGIRNPAHRSGLGPPLLGVERGR